MSPRALVVAVVALILLAAVYIGCEYGGRIYALPTAPTARHGFLLKDGLYTSFDPPGSVFTFDAAARTMFTRAGSFGHPRAKSSVVIRIDHRKNLSDRIVVPEFCGYRELHLRIRHSELAWQGASSAPA